MKKQTKKAKLIAVVKSVVVEGMNRKISVARLMKATGLAERDLRWYICTLQLGPTEKGWLFV